MSFLAKRMLTYPYANLHNPRNSLEVVDSHNRPLCVVNRAEAMRQGLCHRAVALLAMEKGWRMVLKYRAGSGWGVSSLARIPAGAGCEDCAKWLLGPEWRQPDGRLQFLGLWPPCTENGQAFVAFFSGRIASGLARQRCADAEQYMAVDYDELRGLAAHFGELLSPFLRMAVKKGYARPL